jgi:hypothetical protein
MAIRINLLAEAQALEEQRRKDPVKRAIWIGAFCVSLVLLWMLKLQLDIGFAQSDYEEKVKSWTNNMARYASVTNNQIQIVEVEQKTAALDRLATNRFLWAPVLNALQKTMVDNVQVIHLTGEQRYEKEEARVLGRGSTKVTIPEAATEKVTLYIDAKDYDSNDQGYNKFKESLCNFDFFVVHTGRKDGFILDGTLSGPTADAGDPSRQFVTFRLTSHFQEVRRIGIQEVRRSE